VETVYQLKWKSNIRTQLRSLPNRIREETVQAILNLRDEPFPPDAEELRDHYKGIWKIKIDGWRILYQVDEIAMTVTVLAVKRRDPNTYVKLFSLFL
jgi:addiction module RelE/StbE family toxin